MVDMTGCFMDNAARLAGVMELVDAPDSKSGARKGVRVRFPPPAPYNQFDFRCQREQMSQRVIGSDTSSVINVYQLLKWSSQ